MHLLFAGHETTTNVLGNALLLQQEPDQLQTVRDDHTLIPARSRRCCATTRRS